MSRRSESEARYQSSRYRGPSPPLSSSSRFAAPPPPRAPYPIYDDEHRSRSRSHYDRPPSPTFTLIEKDIKDVLPGERIIYRDQLSELERYAKVKYADAPTITGRRPEFNTDKLWENIEREDVANLDKQLRRFSVAGDAKLEYRRDERQQFGVDEFGRRIIVEKEEFVPVEEMRERERRGMYERDHSAGRERDRRFEVDANGRRIVIEREDFIPIDALPSRSRRELERDEFRREEFGRERGRVMERDDFVEDDRFRASVQGHHHGGEVIIRKTEQDRFRDNFDRTRSRDRFSVEADYRRSTGSFARYDDDIRGERIRETDLIIAERQRPPEERIEHEREIISTTFKPVEYYRHHRSHHRSESQKRSKSLGREKALKKELKRERKKVKKLQRKLEEESSSSSAGEEGGALIQGEGLTIVRRRHHSRHENDEEESGGIFGIGKTGRKPQPIIGFI